jgi:hypothetical protein
MKQVVLLLTITNMMMTMNMTGVVAMMVVLLRMVKS